MAREELEKSLEGLWKQVKDIEPAVGAVGLTQITELRSALDRLTGLLAELDRSATADSEASKLRQAAAVVLSRAAAVAFAAGERAQAERWLTEAEALADDDDRPVIAAARQSLERYRVLVHGRYLIARQRDAEARKLWASLAKDHTDALATAADAELKAPRALRPGESPTLFRFNGCGVGFYGRRDTWPDRSYATTHCISIAFVPVFALSAWRVRDASGGYHILAREQLSPFARSSRWAFLAAAVLAIAIAAIASYVNDPERLAENRWDSAFAAAKAAEPEAALHQLDDEIALDGQKIDIARGQRAAAEIVRLTAGFVGAPFTADKVDQAIRMIRRYQGLPPRLHGGDAEAVLLDLVEGWANQLGNSADVAEARLALLGAASDAASGPRKSSLAIEIGLARLNLARAQRASEPVYAFSLVVSGTGLGTTELAEADEIAAQLAETPSLLIDADSDVDTWLAATKSSELNKRITKLRFDAASGRSEATAEGVTAVQLAAMAKQRPWDQFVKLQLARLDASAGNTAAAAARLTALGAPGATIREARFFAAQLAAADGKLEAADRQFAGLLGPRVTRFTAVSAALRDAFTAAQTRLDATLRDNAPADLRAEVEAAHDDNARRDIISRWIDTQMKNEPAIAAARARYIALSDVVPISIAAGSVKLRRAQALSGPPRDRMLGDAERIFLAIRTEAEGEPSFKLGLGQIYARLGKTAESEAAFADVLAKHDPELDLSVAAIQRDLGNTARAKQVAEQVFGTAPSPHKERAAMLIAVIANDDDEAETWYRKSDASRPEVQASLLEIQARRLKREGKAAECAAKFEESAKLELSLAHTSGSAGYNNAAVSYEQAFNCNTDPAALRQAISALETAYQQSPETGLVVRNLVGALEANGRLRALSQLVDARALSLNLEEVNDLIETLSSGAERAALRSHLASEPSIHRSSELLSQLEVLSPSSATAYQISFFDAWSARDVERATGVYGRAHAVKSLDTSETVEANDRHRRAAHDAKFLSGPENTRRRLTALLASPAGQRLDVKTRAAGWYLAGQAMGVLGLYHNDRAMLGQARAAAATAVGLWPALDGNYIIVEALLDEAGNDADAAGWLALRRDRSGAGALAKLVASHSPIADKIRHSKPWAEVAGHAAISSPPTLWNLRLARLLGDAALEAQARPVLDDKLERIRRQFQALIDPSDPSAAEDLAYLDAR